MPRGKKIEPSGITAHQLAFVQEYIQLRELNGAEAARRAGEPASSARQRAHEWLKMPEVQSELKRYREEREKIVVAKAADVLHELLTIAKSDIFDVVEPGIDGGLAVKSNICEDSKRAVKSITTKVSCRETDHGTDRTTETRFEMHDKTNALKILATNLGMLTTKVEHSGTLSFVDAVKAAMEIPPEE